MGSALRTGFKRLLEKLVELVPRSVLLDRMNFERWQKRGFHVTRVHFHQPVPDTRDLPERLWTTIFEMRGVDMASDRQLAVLEELASFKTEYETADIIGASFGCPDAEMLWAMVRHHKPRRVIEVGTGQSTSILARALARNAEEDASATCDFQSIDPFPNRDFTDRIVGGHHVLEQPVQDVPLERFEELEAGDMLFIDSTHIVAVGSPSRFEILEILPRLAPGVLIHFHDILLPYEYKREWVMEGHIFWNEAYLLQGFLAFNDSFNILISGCYLDAYHREALIRAFDRYDPDRQPGSIWIKRVR